ncbi:uncharacterized [Tachysurus ichikawai]
MKRTVVELQWLKLLAQYRYVTRFVSSSLLFGHSDIFQPRWSLTAVSEITGSSRSSGTSNESRGPSRCSQRSIGTSDAFDTQPAAAAHFTSPSHAAEPPTSSEPHDLS